jgi:hypothetical protein
MADFSPHENHYFMQEAVIAGDAVIIETQKRLIREAYYAINELLGHKPMLGAFNYHFPDGRTAGTLGNLRVELKREGSING